MKKQAILLISLILISNLAFAMDPYNMVVDPLRMISDFAKSIDVFVKVIVFLFSLGMFLIAALACKKMPSQKRILIGLAFMFFVIKWGLKIVDLFVSPGYFLQDSAENIFELLILGSLFLAIFRK